MRARADFQRWDVEIDEDAQTCVYFEPVATMQPQPAPPIVQRIEHTPPAPMPLPMRTLPAPARITPTPLRATSPQATRIVPRGRSRAGLGILVASTCVAVGIVLGTVLASSGSTRVTSEAPAAPAVAVAPAPVATVTPIEAPAPPPPAAIVAPVEPPPVAPPPVAQVEQPAAAPVEPPSATASRRAHHHRPHVAPVAVGTLAVSSKPPCAIYVDGKNTGLVAPQRSIELAVGMHEVTLVNAEQGIHLTQEVEISADRATKVIRDFTE